MRTTLKRTALTVSSKYYEDDELDTCVEEPRELLQYNALPRYHCMMTPMLLGSAMKYGCSSPFSDKSLPFHSDWHEERRCCIEADTLWWFVRRLHPAGENEKNDATVTQLRDYILELRAVIDKE